MQSQKRLQQEFRAHITTQNPQMMITFNYDRQVTCNPMQAHITDLANRMQHRVLGRGWVRTRYV